MAWLMNQFQIELVAHNVLSPLFQSEVYHNGVFETSNHSPALSGFFGSIKKVIVKNWIVVERIKVGT